MHGLRTPKRDSTSVISIMASVTVTYQLTNIIHNGLVRKRSNLGNFMGYGKRCQFGNSPIWEILWDP